MITSALIIVGCPRSGTTLIYNILSEIPSLWSLGYESKGIIEKYHHPRMKAWSSGELDASDLTAESQTLMLQAFEQEAASGVFWRRINRLRSRLRGKSLWQSIKRRGQQPSPFGALGAIIPQQGLDLLRKFVFIRNSLNPFRDQNIHLLEKTPENCLRLPFLAALFPRIKVIYLIRDGRANVHSLMEGWRQPFLFPGYQVPKSIRIPGYTRDRWAFTLIPGWEDLLESPLEEVCAWQWVRCNQAILTHEAIGSVPYLRIRYEDLISQPEASFRSIASFIDVPFNDNFEHLRNGLPLINVLSLPRTEKWREESEKIEHVYPLMADTMSKLGYEDDWGGDTLFSV